MELDEQHGLNKFTSLKALFKSTDPTKHFHGSKVAKFTPAKDQPELSPAELISTSDPKNKPKEPSKSFKEQLLLVYSNSIGLNELKQIKSSNGGRKVTDLNVARQKEQGLSIGSKNVGGVRGSGEKILQKTRELERKEKNLTGNDSEQAVNKLSRDDVNTKKIKPQIVNPTIIKPSVASTNTSSQKTSTQVKPSVASTNSSSHKTSEVKPPLSVSNKTSEVKPPLSVSNKYSNAKSGIPIQHNQLKSKLVGNYYKKQNKG